MSFLDHLVELRSRIIKSVAAVAVGTIIGLFSYHRILEILARPYQDAVAGDRLAYFQPTEAFSLVMKIGLFGGVILASPVIVYQIWRFVGPALTRRERRYVIPLSGVMGGLFVGGVALGYATLPLALRVLLGFGTDLLDPTIGANFYLSFAMRFLLAFGIAFEFPVFLFAAAALHIVRSDQLRAQRRWAVVVVTVAAALMTPGGDPLTLALLATPMYLLYEATILAIRLVLKR
jgi:sec-independent protein translocase protein TatC